VSYTDDYYRKHQVPTPFAFSSWEPRFAFDGGRVAVDSLELALHLHVKCNLDSLGGVDDENVVFRGYRLTPTRIAVAAPSIDFPSRLREGELMFENVNRSAAARAISEWLRNQAEYPERPWFDGSEAQGFQAFHVPYVPGGNESLGPYGYMVVEPKWFEVHK
jgi:hypothetical protein